MSNKYILAGNVLEIVAHCLEDPLYNDYTLENTPDNLEFIVGFKKTEVGITNKFAAGITLSKSGDYIYIVESEIALYCANLLKEAGAIIAKQQGEPNE